MGQGEGLDRKGVYIELVRGLWSRERRICRDFHIVQCDIFYQEVRNNMRGSQARTERGEFSFTVKEFADGTPWIMAEPDRQMMPALKDAFIGFDLPDGTTFEQAHKVADFMNRNLPSMSMTIFDTHPLYERETRKLIS